MGSSRRIVARLTIAIALAAVIALPAYAVIQWRPAEPVSASSADPEAMRAAATAVSRQVQGTMTVRRVDLATRVSALPTPAPAPQVASAADLPLAAASSASPAVRSSASPAALASPTALPPDPLLPPTYRFYRGINFGGGPEIVEGRPWLGDAQARAEGLVTPNAAPVTDSDDPLSPPTDPATARMLQTTNYVTGPGGLRVTLPVPNGTYAAYVYVIENYQTEYRRLDVSVEGNVARTNWNAVRGGWEKLGPYIIAVADGALDIEVTATAGDPLVAGLAIFRAEETSPSAIISDQDRVARSRAIRRLPAPVSAGERRAYRHRAEETEPRSAGALGESRADGRPGRTRAYLPTSGSGSTC